MILSGEQVEAIAKRKYRWALDAESDINALLVDRELLYAEVERLEAERDKFERRWLATDRAFTTAQFAREKAEADNERLREALRGIGEEFGDCSGAMVQGAVVDAIGQWWGPVQCVSNLGFCGQRCGLEFGHDGPHDYSILFTEEDGDK